MLVILLRFSSIAANLLIPEIYIHMKAYKLIESTADEIIANGCTIERHIITAKLRSIIASYQSELYNIVKPIEIDTHGGNDIPRVTDEQL
jgi:hypothetical protein